MEAKKTINFMQRDGFPFDQDTFDFFQKYTSLLQVFGKLGSRNITGSGNTYIISGCDDLGGGAIGDGYIYMNGMVYPLQGGPGAFFIKLTTTFEDEVFNDGLTSATDHKYTNEILQFASGAGTTQGVDYQVWAAVKRLPSIEDLNNTTNALNNLISAIIAGQAWVAPTFGSHWLNEDTSLYPAAAYFTQNLISSTTLKRIQFRGIIKQDLGPITTVAWTMPAGKRPSQDLRFGCDILGATDRILLFVGQNGDVRVDTGNSPTYAINQPIIIDHITYLAEQ